MQNLKLLHEHVHTIILHLFSKANLKTDHLKQLASSLLGQLLIREQGLEFRSLLVKIEEYL